MRNVVFWGSLPFLAPQALYVRRTAPRFAAASGPSKGAVGTGPGKRLVAIGDSIVAGVGAETLDDALVGCTARFLARELDCRVHWEAIGAAGYNSRKVIDHLLPQVPAATVDYFVVSVGVNDITGVKTISTWRKNLDALLRALASHSPNAMIGVAGIPPLHGFPLLPQPLRTVAGLRGRSFELAGLSIASGFPQVVHVPVDFEPEPSKFADDGYHPSPESYRLFGDAMARSLLAGQPVSMLETRS